jgi:hypothetical protein
MALLLLEPVFPNKLNGLKQDELVLAVLLLVLVLVALLLVVLLPTLALAVPKIREVRSAIVELLRT